MASETGQGRGEKCKALLAARAENTGIPKMKRQFSVNIRTVEKFEFKKNVRT